MNILGLLNLKNQKITLKEIIIFGKINLITGLVFLEKKLGNMMKQLIHIIFIYLEKNNLMLTGKTLKFVKNIKK